MSAVFSDFMIQFLKEREASFSEEIVHLDGGPAGEISAADVRQMMQGFFKMLTDSLAGSNETRALYLETVLPGVRDSGVGLHIVIGPLVSMAVRLAALSVDRMPAEHRMAGATWLARFFADYTMDVTKVWTVKQ